MVERPDPAVFGRAGLVALTMKAFAITVLGGLCLTACAAPATRISLGLQRYGLDAERSDCVGTRLQADLSLGQLQQLGRAAAAYRKGDTSPGVLTVGDLLRVAAEIRDPAIALAVGKAAAGCSVLREPAASPSTWKE